MMSSSSLGDVFSFDTPEAVLRVLAAIRACDATTEQKNELRDLVLSYTNGGKDPSVQIQISQRLQNLGVTPVAAKVQPEPVVHEFGSSRNVPTFVPSKAAQASTAPTPKPATSAEPSAPPTPPTPPAAPAVDIPAAPVAETPPAAPATPTEPPAPAPATPAAPQAPVTEVPPAAPVQPAAAPQAPVTEPTPIQTVPGMEPAPVAKASSGVATPESDEALIRIREIKSLVNQKVGNPVNLVDIDNVVGREYMSALLDAMKQLNSGSSTVPAMSRLESAYQAVEEVLKTHGAQPDTVVEPVPTPAPAPAPEPTPEPALQTATEPVPKPVTPVTPIETPVTPVESQPAPDTQEPVKQPTPEVGAINSNRWANSGEKRAINTAPTPTEPAKPAAESVSGRAAPIKSLNDSAAPLKTIDDVPTAASGNSSETGDPLYTKEVTNGLNQLLSDWTLFKKSGLFGTGPKGVEHPLYAKVKDLQIPLLLAGRFEGATQEIKQSVTDYMNGWRYEQGIIYEQGEVFDHYLRRVIRHILDLQK